jgi:hypothetical protein
MARGSMTLHWGNKAYKPIFSDSISMASPIYDSRVFTFNKDIFRAIKAYGDAIEDEYRTRYTLGFVAGFIFGVGTAFAGMYVFLEKRRVIPRLFSG